MIQHKWMNDAYRNAARVLIRLMGGALNQRDPGELPQDVALAHIARIAKWNDVEGLVFCALKYMRQPPCGEFYEQMKKAWSRTCYKQLCFDEEREEILQSMAAEGLSYLPLKGILLAGYYPEPGMRSMADNDILYGYTGISDVNDINRAADIVCRIMQSRGYTPIQGHGNLHDAFHKEPFYNFEMHRRLVSKANNLYFYYADPWARAISDKDGGAGYHFRDEDEYIYNIVHALNHMEEAGFGVRFFADLYVFLKKKGDGLDRRYITQEMEILGFARDEERLRHMALTAFDTPDLLTEAQQEELFFYMGCGTYGSLEARTNILMDKLKAEKSSRMLRLRYIKKRLFLSENIVQIAFPKMYQNRFLRPFIPVYRIWSALTKRPKTIAAEIRELFSSISKR